MKNWKLWLSLVTVAMLVVIIWFARYDIHFFVFYSLGVLASIVLSTMLVYRVIALLISLFAEYFLYHKTVQRHG